ncbi:MAG: helix-turn-helix domain-containing protein [Acidobacteriota bacterium]
MSSSDVPIRDVLICPSCGLRQFVGPAALCRRCRKPLPVAQLEISLVMLGSNRRSLGALIGKTVRQLRRRRGYSQSTLAAKIRSHRTHISRIEHGQVIPTLAMLVRAAVALGVDNVLLRVRD